ncbi:hypothetical protein Bhyg_02229, partial [Pseudolycoriella hygida]
EPQGNIDRQITQNLRDHIPEDEGFNLQNFKRETTNPVAQETKSNWKEVGSRKRNENLGSQLLRNGVFDRNKNSGLAFTPPNSPISERTYVIRCTSSSFETDDTLETDRPQKNTRKFANERTKNLFTIVNTKREENANFTKDRLIRLIDEELDRIETGGHKRIQNHDAENESDDNLVAKLKLECIRKIEDELRLIKRLTNRP